jgi:L-alanine-DL-glutamate epimerase-like enolase superfamily enzyme
MKITDVRTVRLTRSLDKPQRHSQGGRASRTFTFVLVETDTGHVGLGDAFGDDALVQYIVDKRIGPMSIGLDPCDIPAVWKHLFTSRAFWETAGSVMCAISAVEVACWDIRGKAEGVPVYELLGGKHRDSIQAYASDLHWEEAHVMAETAARYVDAGYRYVKTHIGAPQERSRDVERATAVREAIGPDVGFMIDINTALTREQSGELGEALAGVNPFWYEEPVSPVDYEGHALLRERLPFPIATGENLYGTYGFAPLFDAGGCDYAMPDILRCGGIAQTAAICELAKQHGVVASPHNYSSGVGTAATLHLMAALPDTQLLEFDPTGTAIYEELFVDGIGFDKGYVEVPTRPGLGVELTDATISRWS